MKKIAVVLLSMGGPDCSADVRPFLTHLFDDPAILGLANPWRYFVARLIAAWRTPQARQNYAKLGGGSPLRSNTQEQAVAIERALNATSVDPVFHVFMAMRYWHPSTLETVHRVLSFEPAEIVLVPMYPQFSTVTTQSSLKAWSEVALAEGLDVPTWIIPSYPEEAGFIRAMAVATREACRQAAPYGKPRVLFSAHGLPEKKVLSGDPYVLECRRTVAALEAALAGAGYDGVLCYQSRIGPVKWTGPSTEDEIRRGAKERRPLVVVPVSFVCDHVETLVEIGEVYRELALHNGAPFFVAVPPVGTQPDFIAGLVQRIRDVRTQDSAASCKIYP